MNNIIILWRYDSRYNDNQYQDKLNDTNGLRGKDFLP